LIYFTQKTGTRPEKQEKGREDGYKLGRRNVRAKKSNFNVGMH